MMETSLFRIKPVAATLTLVLMTAVILTSLTGCASRAATGALIGSAAGAAIGGNFGPDSSERSRNALIGAGIGAGLGYMTGNEMDKQQRRSPYYDWDEGDVYY